jgi:1,4-dihydroxy-2-naphthoyl-CoA hydrolase
MAIWKTNPSIAHIMQLQQGTMGEHLGIEVLEIGPDFLRGRMPVDARTKQPMGLLHGGASVALAESLGSVAGKLCLDPGNECVGLEINANHIRAVRGGYVTGTARPVHLGIRTQVWSIEITEESRKIVCVSRLTLAIIGPDQIAK